MSPVDSLWGGAAGILNARGWRWRREGRLMCLESWVGDICGFRSSILKILAKVMYFLLQEMFCPLFSFWHFWAKKFWGNVNFGQTYFLKEDLCLWSISYSHLFWTKGLMSSTSQGIEMFCFSFQKCFPQKMFATDGLTSKSFYIFLSLGMIKKTLLLKLIHFWTYSTLTVPLIQCNVQCEITQKIKWAQMDNLSCQKQFNSYCHPSLQERCKLQIPWTSALNTDSKRFEN